MSNQQNLTNFKCFSYNRKYEIANTPMNFPNFLFMIHKSINYMFPSYITIYFPPIQIFSFSHIKIYHH